MRPAMPGTAQRTTASARPPATAPPWVAKKPPLGGPGAGAVGSLTIVVSSTSDDESLGLETLVGEYAESGTNHGKKVFKRKRQPTDTEDGDVYIYFWDLRDGPNFGGWWFGEEAGGQKVWARCPKAEALPPLSGWLVPWDGDEQPTLVVKRKQAAAAPPKARVPKQPASSPPKAPGTTKPAGKTAVDIQILDDDDEPEAPAQSAPKPTVDSIGNSTAAEDSVFKAAKDSSAETDTRVKKATEKISLAEIEATQALDSIRAMMVGEVTNESLKMVEELIQTQLKAMLDAHRKLAVDIMEAKKVAPKMVGDLTVLQNRLRVVQASISKERNQVKQVHAKKRQEVHESQQRARHEEMQMLAQQRDAKLLEEGLPEAMEVVTVAEDALEIVIAAAEPLSSGPPESMDEKVLATIKETEAAVAKAQEAFKAAKLKLAQKIAGANSFGLEAKKVALTEYKALQEKVDDAQKKLAPYLRFRMDQEQRMRSQKILDEVSATLGSVEVEVEKVTSMISGIQCSENDINAADALAPPVLANLEKALRLVEAKMRLAQGALKQDLQQMQERGMESKKKLETFRIQCNTLLEKSQLKGLLKQGLEKTRAAEEALSQTTEAEEPFIKGLELEGAEATEAIAKCKSVCKVVETEVSAAKSFLKAKLGELKRLSVENQEAARGELADLAMRVETASHKLNEFKKDASEREIAIVLREVVAKVITAEDSVQKAIEVSSPLQADKLEDVDAADLKQASEQTMEAEKAAALACADARKAIITKQKDGLAKDSTAFGAKLQELQAKLTAAQQELTKQRKVAVQGEKIWKIKHIVEEKEGQLKQVEADVEKAELQTTPMGDDTPSNESVIELGKKLDTMQNMLNEVVNSLDAAQPTVQGSLKAHMGTLLERAKTSQKKLDEMKETTREQRDRIECQAILDEARAKLVKVEESFQQCEKAEAPYLKGMEIIPVDEATKAVTDSIAAAAIVQKLINEARPFMMAKQIELKKLMEAVSKPGIQGMQDLMKKMEDSIDKLADFKKDTESRKEVALKQEAEAKVAAVEEAVKMASAAVEGLSANKDESQEAAEALMGKLAAVMKEAEQKLNEARRFLEEKGSEIERFHLIAKLAATQVDLAKSKSQVEVYEQTVVASILTKEVAQMLSDLERQTEQVIEEAAPLVEEGGKKFVVASMIRMITEALGEYCSREGIPRQDIFRQMSPETPEGGKVLEAEFVAYLEKVPEKCGRPDLAFSAEQRAAIFEQLDDDLDGSIVMEDFIRLFKERHLCTKEVTVTEGFDVADCKTITKLQLSDVVEELAEPKTLDSHGVVRMKVKVEKDGTEGWVTTRGTSGSTYFSPLTLYAAFMSSLDKLISATVSSGKKAIDFMTHKFQELRDCKTGPLADAKAEVIKTRSKINILRAQLDSLSRKVEEGRQKHSKREAFEQRKQEEKKERKAASVILKAISEKVEKIQDVLATLEKKAAPFSAIAEAELLAIETPVTLRKEAQTVEKELKSAIAEARACLAAHHGKVEKACKGPWHEAKQEMNKLDDQAEALEKKAELVVKALEAGCETIASARYDQASAALRASLLAKEGLTAEALFAELARDGHEQIEEAVFCSHLDKLEGLQFPAEQKQLVVQKAGGIGGLGRRSLSMLLERHLRCAKEIALTRGFDVAVSNAPVRKIKVGEHVEVLEGPRSDNTHGILRVSVRALVDGVTGWATVKGNRDTTYFVECPKPCYCITEEVVMQDTFGTDATNNLRCLRVGEVVEVIEGPRQEILPNAMRMKCKTVSDEATGWMTATTQQGTPCARKGQGTYTCRSAIALTDVANMKECKVLRKLNKGEVLQSLEGPIDDPVAGVARIRAKAKKDGMEGWVTIRGNAGSIILDETGCTWVITRKTPLQADFRTDSGPEVRSLEPDELVEVLEGPKEEKSEPMMRLHCRAVADGKEGWITLKSGAAMPWSPVYNCLEETALSQQLDAEVGAKVRDLEPGETVELLDGPREDPTTGALRLKGRAAMDKAVGWVSISTKDGRQLLQCVAPKSD